MKYINDFCDAYKTLENLLRVVTGIENKAIPIVSYFIKMLPPKLSADMDVIREFRNKFHGHGVKVGGKAPQAPDTYTSFINNEIRWIDNNRQLVKDKINKIHEEKMSVSKQATPAPSKPQVQEAATPPAPQKPKKEKNKPHKAKKSTETGTSQDEHIKLKATLVRGEGRYTKGLLSKKSMVNFKLNVAIENQDGLKIKSVTAHLKGNGASLEKKLPTSLNSTTEFDLPVNIYGGNIQASIIVIYKIGLTKTKPPLKVTVSKNF